MIVAKKVLFSPMLFEFLLNYFIACVLKVGWNTQVVQVHTILPCPCFHFPGVDYMCLMDVHVHLGSLPQQEYLPGRRDIILIVKEGNLNLVASTTTFFFLCIGCFLNTFFIFLCFVYFNFIFVMPYYVKPWFNFIVENCIIVILPYVFMLNVRMLKLKLILISCSFYTSNMNTWLMSFNVLFVSCIWSNKIVPFLTFF